MVIPATPNPVEAATLVATLPPNGDDGALVTAGDCCDVVLPNNDGDDAVELPNTDVPDGLCCTVGEPKTFVPCVDLTGCGLALLPPKIEAGDVAVALANIDGACVVFASVVAGFPNIDDCVVVAAPPKIEPVDGLAVPKTLIDGAALCGTEPKFNAPA